jgi:NSS family neurotransmitter:Na+ symporter
MPGGHFFGSVFFILLVFAAWTSSISLLESSVEWLEEKGLSRAAAAITGGVAAWALGLASLLSLNLWSQFQPLGLGKTIFDLLDYLTANIMMPLAGQLTAIFGGGILSRNISEQELQNAAGYRLWRFLIRYVAPVAVLAIALYNLI